MSKLNLDALAGLDNDQLEAALRAALEYKKTHLLEFWTPYPKQSEFIALGKDHNERLFLAGNQVGKSDAGAYELAHHLTGLYPADWNGRKWDHPVHAWAAGESTTVQREVAQSKLCGEAGVEEAFGTGFIPLECFASKPTIARGAVADAYDTVQVYHHTDGVRDGVSTLKFKSYEQGRKKFQGSTLDLIWWDEEPPEDIYEEGNARWSATGGMSFMTFTPLEGMSTVVLKFLEDADPDTRRAWLQFRAVECPHMTPERIADLKSKYPQHTWEARLNGEPFLGSGRIFRTNEKLITFPITQNIPAHWPKLWGIDFGITHPFAAVLCAWDREMDIIYVLETYKAADVLPLVHSEAIRRIAAQVPIAWPHDGHRREAGTGETLAKVYKSLDLKMLPTHSHFKDGSMSTEAAVLEMTQRFADGRLKVREDLGDFLQEYKIYHRKDGLIVKLQDDLLSALMKVIMMKRYAKLVPLGWERRPDKAMLQARRPQNSGVINPWTGRPVSV